MSVVHIQTEGRGCYHSKESLAVVNHALNENLPIRIFWYTAIGKRYEEEMIFREIPISYIITESDPTPWEIDS